MTSGLWKKDTDKWTRKINQHPRNTVRTNDLTGIGPLTGPSSSRYLREGLCKEFLLPLLEHSQEARSIKTVL
jgi:hypothetical protein